MDGALKIEGSEKEENRRFPSGMTTREATTTATTLLG
jgi:hypothetical protein